MTRSGGSVASSSVASAIVAAGSLGRSGGGLLKSSAPSVNTACEGESALTAILSPHSSAARPCVKRSSAAFVEP